MAYLQKKKFGVSISNRDGMLALLNSRESDSGERINSETVFGLPAFLNGVKLISHAIARTDCYVYKNLPNGGREIDDKHDAHWLLTWKANPFQTYYNFRQTLVANALWQGNGYAYIERDELGSPIALYNLDSRNVYPVAEYSEGRLSDLFYAVSTEQGEIPIPADDILHLKNVSIHTGVEGIGIIDHLKMALGKSLAIQRFSTIFYKNGSHITKVLKIPGWLTAEQQEQLRSSLSSLHGGLSNAHKLAVLMGGSELSTLPLSAEDMMLVQSSELDLVTTSNILGLPSSKLGTRDSSYGSLAQDNLAVLSDCYDPIFTNFEAECNVKLLKPRQSGGSHFIEFNRGTLQASEPSYIELLLTQYEKDALSWEELRQALNRSTDRKGTFFSDSKQPEPEAPQQEAPQEPTAEQPQADQQPAQEEQARVEAQAAMGQGLTRAALKRLKKRLAKAVAAGKYSLAEHEPIIREALEGLDASPVIEELHSMQAELDAVLPEQRVGVINKWNIQKTANSLWQASL